MRIGKRHETAGFTAARVTSAVALLRASGSAAGGAYVVAGLNGQTTGFDGTRRDIPNRFCIRDSCELSTSWFAVCSGTALPQPAGRDEEKPALDPRDTYVRK